MVTKQQPVIKKGQTNLFSFFNKPKAANPEQTGVTTPKRAIDQEMNDISKQSGSAATSAAGDSPSTLSSQESTGASKASPLGGEKRKSANLEQSKSAGPIPIAERASRVVKKSNIVMDDEEEMEWNESAKSSRSMAEESSASEGDNLADSSDEEEFDEESDNEQIAKRRRLKKGAKDHTKPVVLSKPPLAPSRQSVSTPLQGSATPASGQSSSVYDRCSAQKMGEGLFPSNQTTPCSIGTPSSVASTPFMPALPEGVVGRGSHEHNTWDFLQPAKRRDKDGNRPDHPSYNPRSLFVPPSFLKTQTPAMAQWWALKEDNMDTVLFFKVGKFYELFHMDADVGMGELELIYMKGSKAHSGFPEVSYGKFAGALVSKGYRVARVEQTETPEMLKDRNDSKSGKKDKVVAREMCSIMSKGTRTYCHLDDLSIFESEGGQGGSLLMCIKERLTAVHREDEDEDEMEGQEEGNNKELVPEYGICCIDTVMGDVTLAQFQDDSQRSRLRTLLTRLTPTEVLLEANGHTAETAGTLRLVVPRAAMEVLRRDEMPSASDALKKLESARYFSTCGSQNMWPPVLQAVVSGLADGSSELVMCSVGGAVWQLKRSLIDYEVLSMGKMFAYIPPDEDPRPVHSTDRTDDAAQSRSAGNIFQTVRSSGGLLASSEREEETSGEGERDDGETAQSPTRMVLDAVALTNLEVLQNNFDRTEKGSLWAFMNRCKTLFGARLLKDWVCHPLYRVSDIASRTAAVDDLMCSLCSEAESARAALKGVPDLERLLSRVHSNGLKKTGRGVEDHPDGRAVMYEMPTYNSRKIRDFSDVLAGFELVSKIGDIFQDANVTSLVLKRIVKSSTSYPLGKFPKEQMDKLLKYFRSIFDEKQAKRDGNIRPRPGVDPNYDQAKADIADTERCLEEYLRELKIKTKINDLKYWGSNKDRYQIEVPISACNKVPAEWTTKSQKKTHRRYWNATIEGLLARMMEAEDREKEAQRDTLRKVFEKFDDSRHVWTDGLRCVANLDALLSLAVVSSAPGYVWPEMVARVVSSNSDSMEVEVERSAVEGVQRGPLLDIQAGRHPMLEFSMSLRGDGDYIPNTLVLGDGLRTKNPSDSVCTPKLLLLSGPNMGGKSTLLRQTCLITILAQIGCKVPADRCVMTPVDRIFTRVGASDRILAGQSTFFVELAETATILKAATENSLCILDELGRGTATFDGTAIAHAVVDHLARSTRCRALFATHYHSLVDDWEMDARVQLGHMDCLVQDSDNGSPSPSGSPSVAVAKDDEEEVTFLYRLCSGSSPRSYGINVARLARLPQEVIALAMRQSREFEQRMRCGEEAVIAPASESGAAVGAIALSRDVSLAYFERLVSIAHSGVPIQELVYLASEMWRRFTSINSSS